MDKSYAQRVVGMAVPAHEEWVVVATDANELHCFALNVAGEDAWQVCASALFVDHAQHAPRQAPDSAFGTTMATSLHRGPVTGIGCCVRKPLVASCGADHTVHVWNTKDCTVELVRLVVAVVEDHPLCFELRLVVAVVEDHPLCFELNKKRRCHVCDWSC